MRDKGKEKGFFFFFFLRKVERKDEFVTGNLKSMSYNVQREEEKKRIKEKSVQELLCVYKRACMSTGFFLM